MKKWICFLGSLLLAAGMLLPVYAAEAGERVYDFCGYLTGQQKDGIEQRIAESVQKTGNDFAVVITDSKGGKSPEAYADDFYDEHGFGTGKDQSGALMLIDMEERTVYVSTSGQAVYYLTDDRLTEMTDGNDQLYEYLKNGDYVNAIVNGIESAEYWYGQGIPKDQHTYNKETGETVYYNARKRITLVELLISLIAAFIPAFLHVKSVRSGYEMKAEKLQAAGFKLAYRAAAAFAFAVAADRLIDSNVSQRVLPMPQSGSGPRGSGSTSGRSTIHTGSSGHMHGGGGGGRHF